MKMLTRCLLALILPMLGLHVRADVSDAKGIKDACVAATLLEASRIPFRVVIFHSTDRDDAGCVYTANGESYLYTLMGSARINPAELELVPLDTVSRSTIYRIADGQRQIRNGCLVYASCAYSGYKHDPHIKWAGIIAARVVNINRYGGDDGARLNLTGHAITAFEDDHREIFIQENGEKPRKLDDMTERAQAGDKSWHDSSTLIYCDHHLQGITTFNCEFGRPL